MLVSFRLAWLGAITADTANDLYLLKAEL